MLKLEALKTELPEAKETLTDLEESLGVQNIRETLADLKIEMETEGFWNDIERAQKRMKLKGQLENSLKEFEELSELLNETEVLVEMAEESEDDEFANEALENQKKFRALAEDLRIRTLLTEEYDENNAIVTIHPGTGGTDAQDWAEMLLRMYTRWAEAKGYKVK
ncbi:MAG: PCRF domain-containing protein, partial [Firmicutes bacterium]|nr:PCRF domain-containing protein [Bacillota bacterium]